MQLLTHRRQVVLLVVVGVLAGVALVCVGLELLGVPVLEPFGVDELFTRHEPPSRVVVEGGGPLTDPDSIPAPSATPHPR